jgi:hypothetical protein
MRIVHLPLAATLAILSAGVFALGKDHRELAAGGATARNARVDIRVEAHSGDSKLTGGNAFATPEASRMVTRARNWPECPHDYYTEPRPQTKGPGPSPFGDVARSGPITDIPEFHDCQRFITAPSAAPETWRYDSLYAVFASFRLDSLEADLCRSPDGVTISKSSDILRPGVRRSVRDSAAARRTGPHVEPHDVEREPVSQRRTPCASRDANPSYSAHAIATATIYSYDTDEYKPLAIQPGWNCLFLYKREQWRARMVSVESDDECLKAVTDPENLGTLLAVRATSPGGTNDGSYPPVARWDWDRSRREHYIGIKCGPAWCEIGRTGFSPSPSQPSAAPTWKVKGWYDEQHLAIPLPSAGAGLRVRPGVAIGTVAPVDDLATFKHEDFAGTWKQVAALTLNAPSPEYASKLLLKGDMSRTFLSFCAGTREDCGIPSNVSFTATTGVYDADLTADPWWAKLSPRQGTPRYYQVVRRKHLGITIPGTARWRWWPDDERIWILCPEGCCETLID